MKSWIVFCLLNIVLFIWLWGHWNLLIILSVAFYYAYQRYKAENPNNLLK